MHGVVLVMFRQMNNDEFDRVFELMSRSFPEDEYRDYDKQKHLVGRDDYRIYVDVDGQAVRAFLAVYEFENFVFVEHFAVDPAFRNHGLGSAMLSRLIRSSGKPLCLEVELPSTQIAARRIGFYGRSGFILNDFEYYQPKLRAGTGILPLRIMSCPDALSREQFERVKAVLYSRVYDVQ